MIVFAYYYHASDPEKPMWIQWSIERILQIIPYGYIMIVIAEYFNSYKLKVLRTTTIILLLFEISGNMLKYFNQAEIYNQNEITVPRFIAIGNAVAWTLIMIVWIIFLFRTSAANFPAVSSIRKYAISVLAVILISGTLPLLINKFVDIQQFMEIAVVVIGVLPYVFFIEFGLKLPMKNQAVT
ncbi:MAG: hypothetical protein WCI54_06210 [Bacteroidia bacterium]